MLARTHINSGTPTPEEGVLVPEQNRCSVEPSVGGHEDLTGHGKNLAQFLF